MTTPSDEEALQRLRALKARLDHANGLADRFADNQLGAGVQALAAEIASFPAHILNAEKISTTLQALTDAVEDYLIARVAQFLPDVPDLWAAVKTLQEQAIPGETPAAKPVAHLLDQLRALGADEAAIQAAVLRAAALDSYRTTGRHVRGTGNRRDYRRLLHQHLAGFLKKHPLPSAAALVALVTTWQQETEQPAEQDSFWTRYYRQSILSAIAVLRKLGSGDAEIDALVAEAYDRNR